MGKQRFSYDPKTGKVVNETKDVRQDSRYGQSFTETGSQRARRAIGDKVTDSLFKAADGFMKRRGK